MKQLIDIARILAQTTDVESLTRPLLKLLQEYTGLESTYLTLVDVQSQTQKVLFACNKGELKISEHLTVPWDDTLCRRALESGEPVMKAVRSRFASDPVIAGMGIESYVSVPVRLGEEQLYGTLCAASSRPEQITEDDQALMTLFATLIGRQLQREQHLQLAHERNAGLERQMAEVQLLSRIGQVCWVADSLQSALSACTSLLAGFGDWAHGIHYHAGSGSGKLDASEVALLLESVPQWEVNAEEHWHHFALLRPDDLSASLVRQFSELLGADPGSIALIRVENDLGLAGLIVLLSVRPLSDDMTTDHENALVAEAAGQYLSLLASRLHQQDQLKILNAELEVEARRDPLTGLNNRRVLMTDLERQLSASGRGQGEFSLAFIDLDGFKQINDHYGHKAGDLFLQAFAGRLAQLCRGSDLAARIGGDEFVVLMPHETTLSGVDHGQLTTNLRDRLSAAFTGPYDLGEFGVLDYQGPSIGVVHYHPGMSDAEALLAEADAAMYAEKRRRRAEAS